MIRILLINYRNTGFESRWKIGQFQIFFFIQIEEIPEKPWIIFWNKMIFSRISLNNKHQSNVCEFFILRVTNKTIFGGNVHHFSIPKFKEFPWKIKKKMNPGKFSKSTQFSWNQSGHPNLHYRRFLLDKILLYFICQFSKIVGKNLIKTSSKLFRKWLLFGGKGT